MSTGEFTREEFQKAMVDRSEELTKSRAREMSRMEQAAVEASYLLGDEKWDYFLSIIQAKINQIESQLERVPGILTSGETRTPEQLYAIQRDVTRLQSTRDALESVMRLPKQIVEDADEAKGALAEVG